MLKLDGFNSTTNSTYPMRKHGYRLHLRQPMHYYPTVFSVFVILQINVFSALSSWAKLVNLSFDGSLESVFVDQVETNWYICNFSFSMQRLTLVWVSCLPFQSLSSLNCIVTPLLDHISHIPMVALSKCRTVKKSVSYLYFHEKAQNSNTNSHILSSDVRSKNIRY